MREKVGGMKNAMRNGSLLLVLAAICAVTLIWTPASTYAASAGGGGQSWTDDSPGGGSTNGDPDQPDPSKAFGYPRWGASLSVSPIGGSTGSATPVNTVSSGSLRGWLQPLIWALGVRIGGYYW